MLNRHLNCFFNEYTSSPGLILSLTSTKDIVILFGIYEDYNSLIDTRVNTYYNLIKVKTLIVSYEG